MLELVKLAEPEAILKFLQEGFFGENITLAYLITAANKVVAVAGYDNIRDFAKGKVSYKDVYSNTLYRGMLFKEASSQLLKAYQRSKNPYLTLTLVKVESGNKSIKFKSNPLVGIAALELAKVAWEEI